MVANANIILAPVVLEVTVAVAGRAFVCAVGRAIGSRLRNPVSAGALIIDAQVSISVPVGAGVTVISNTDVPIPVVPIVARITDVGISCVKTYSPQIFVSMLSWKFAYSD